MICKSQQIIIWDHDGTIMGTKNPNDVTKIILPNVEQVMKQENIINIICSGMKTIESEMQNFDPEKIIERFKRLMITLPIRMAVFSPAIGGVECWMLIKHDNHEFEVKKAHIDSRYIHLIGQFKKPDTGMLTVIKDYLYDQGIELTQENTVFIGDALQDEHAAYAFNIPFIHATSIHGMTGQ